MEFYHFASGFVTGIVFTVLVVMTIISFKLQNDARLIREALTEQEPVAWVDAKEEGYEFYGISCLPVGKHHLYAAPVSAKREWVELTDDEIWDVFISKDWTGEPLQLMSAVIAAFKEKNK